MPSALPLPTISDLLQAGKNAVRGEFDRFADVRSGALYDHVAGPMAILFAREADQDKDNFQAIYFDDARGDDLTYLVQGRQQLARGLDAKGQGVCTFLRSSPTKASTFWPGSRIQVPGTPPGVYEVADKTVVASTAARADVPIQAIAPGPGVACLASSGLQILDPLDDASWTAASLTCADGSLFEPADTYRARARQARLSARTGYLAAMVTACQNAGASYVVAFASTYGLASSDFTSDAGLSALYVADSNYQSPTSLVDACAVALEGARVLGNELWVGGITQQALTFVATVYLVDDPGRLPIVAIRQAANKAILTSFSATSAGYTYDLGAIGGAAVQAHPAIQRVVFTAPGAAPALPNVTSPVIQKWPGTLTRYTATPNSVLLTFSGPS